MLELKVSEKSWLPKRVKVALVVMIGIAVVIIGIRFAFSAVNPFYLVVSDSMSPTINIGDLIVVKQNVNDASFANLKTGDIIAFNERFLDQKIVISRIASIQTSSIDGKQYMKIITKNDNSDWKAQDSVIAENYIGKVVYTIPHVAQIFEVLKTQLVMVIIIGTPLAIILLYYYGKKKKRIKCEKRSAP